MRQTLTPDSLIALIREHQRVAPKLEIGENSLLEKDLGITGDDGCELLEAIQEKFEISFLGQDGTIKDAFNLKDGQYLFHSEGMGLFWLIARLFDRDLENVKPITVGELYRAACKANDKSRSL